MTEPIDLDDTSTAPAVSIVVPVLNEARTIERTLRSILAQSHTDFEVLVVDGLSDDDTAAIVESVAESDDRVRLLTNPRRSIPAALNVALSNARGRYLMRVDAHSTIAADYVARMLTHLESGQWAGVGGRKNAVGHEPSGTAISAALGSPFGVGGSDYHYATDPRETDHIPYGSYPTQVAIDVGGWDERLVANEDYEFDVRVRRAGGKLLLDPSITIQWTCRSRIPDLARQYRRYGRGKADVAFLHPDEVRTRHLAPPLAVASLAIAAASLPVSRVPAKLVVGGYTIGVLALSLPIMRSLARWRDRLRVPAVLAAMQLPWGVGMWEGFFRIASHGFELPPRSDEDSTRWGSPEWEVPIEPSDLQARNHA